MVVLLSAAGSQLCVTVVILSSSNGGTSLPFAPVKPSRSCSSVVPSSVSSLLFPIFVPGSFSETNDIFWDGSRRRGKRERVSECEKEERTLIHVYPVSHALAENIPSLPSPDKGAGFLDRFGAKEVSHSSLLFDILMLPSTKVSIY